MAITIEHTIDTEACVVHLAGEVDIAVVPEIRQQLGVSIEGGCRNVVLDLAAVTYADSSALGLLVWIDHKLAPHDGRLILVGANRDVTRVLELSGLVGVAPSISAGPSVDAALEGLDLAPVVKDSVWRESFGVPAEIESLASVRSHVVDLLRPLGMSEASLFDVKVAVGEALANAVRHGSPQGASDDVGIVIEAFDDRVAISVRDSGCGFDGESACAGDVYAAGGRGVMFMHALMDRVSFETGTEGGTVVTLVKHLLPEAQQPRIR